MNTTADARRAAKKALIPARVFGTTTVPPSVVSPPKTQSG